MAKRKGFVLATGYAHPKGVTFAPGKVFKRTISHLTGTKPRISGFGVRPPKTRTGR